MALQETNQEASDRHDGEAISIAVISSQVASLKELMLEKLNSQDVQLSLIKEQTTKTNGHVADAFREIATINAWKNKFVGAMIISNIFIVPTLMFFLFERLRLK